MVMPCYFSKIHHERVFIILHPTSHSLNILLAWVLEKAMAPHSSTLAWKIPWIEESGRLQSMGSLRVRHDWVTELSLFTFMHWRRNGNPLQCSCLENPRNGGAWWATVYGIAQSWTWLKWLSSSSSSLFWIQLEHLEVLSSHIVEALFGEFWTSLC